ncbi:NDPK3 [Symbiodinium sp. KB8]|nr:NDPK3 [Symbiodinium sp. KB8]
MAFRRAASTAFRAAAAYAKPVAAVAASAAAVTAATSFVAAPVMCATAAPHTGVPGTAKERTFIACKPDAVQRKLVGEIIRRFEAKGWKLVGLKMVHPTKELASAHYADLSSKPFFDGLVDFFSSGPIVAMVWEGTNCIKGGRKLMGTTNPLDSTPGSIRGDLCVQVGRNIIHGSDGPESAQAEIANWFTPEELVEYTTVDEAWILAGN